VYELWVCNSSGAKIARVKNLVHLQKNSTNVLEFSDYLSSWGSLKFRVQTKDPIASQGYFDPYKYHVKLYRNQKLVWAGIIVNNPSRNHNFIEVEAYTYEWLFTRIPIATPSTDKERVFNTGTMATAVTTVFNEGKAISSSPISTYTLGDIDNPNYPWNGQPWNFTDVYVMNFYYNDLFTVLSSFADVTNADFEVTPDKVFNFKSRIGSDRLDIVLKYGKSGNVDDYDSPLDGGGYTNDMLILSRNETGAAVIKNEQSSADQFPTYGRLWSTVSLDEEIAQDILNSKSKNIYKASAELDNQVNMTLNDKALPIGTYQLGDRITVQIDDGPVQFNHVRRVVGWRVNVTDTMVERATIITNNNTF